MGGNILIYLLCSYLFDGKSEEGLMILQNSFGGFLCLFFIFRLFISVSYFNFVSLSMYIYIYLHRFILVFCLCLMPF